MALKAGVIAPDFSLKNQDGVLVHLKDHVTKSLVLLAFYPGDFTSVCTKELVCFKEDHSLFEDLDCKIFGISCDAVDKHKKFTKEYGFPFDLLADPEAQVASLYGVKLPFVKKANRAIFIIDLHGKIGYAYQETLPVFYRSNEELRSQINKIKSNS